MANSPDDPTHDFQRTLALINGRRAEYERRSNYYHGTNAEVIAHPQLEKLLEHYGDGTHFGLTYAAVPVDALMDRVDLTGLTVTDDEEATKRLKEAFWDENDLDDDADDYHTKAGYLGDYYALVWPDDDAAEDVANGEPLTVDMLGKHPKSAGILYDDENEREPITFVFVWHAGPSRWRANQVYDDVVYEWVAEDSKLMPLNDPGKWERVGDETNEDDGLSAIPNPYGWPVLHFRPDSKPYGTPINLRGYGAQDAITKLNASDMATIDYVVLPQRYALLDPDAEEDDDIAEDFNDHAYVDGPALDYDPSRMVNRKGGKLKALPGSTWLLRGVKQVGQFDPIQGTPFQDREEFQIRSMAVLTRTPLYEFMPESDNSPSGEARRRADGSITKHAKKVMGSFGSEWAKAGELALKMLNLNDKDVEPVWMPPEVATDKEGMELVSLKTENGVPITQALSEAGYTDEQITEWFPKGDKVRLTVDMLKNIGPAMQGLGQAITLGSASEDDVRKMLPWLLIGTAPEDVESKSEVALSVGANPVLEPTGKLNADGTPEMAPPKGVTPPQLAPTALPGTAPKPAIAPPVPPAPAKV